MKKFCNYAFKLVCIYIIVLSIFSIFNIENTKYYYNSDVNDVNKNKVINSTLFVDKSILEESTSIVNEVIEGQNEQLSDTNELETTNNVEEVLNIVDTSNYEVLQQEIINLSHYGHDCLGCTTGKTASGYYVGDGRLYYQDETFGSVRVVAADSKYPLGTIVRIGYHDSSIIAIVLDRGGGIGDGKRFQIDLLASSESVANELGIVKNTTLEVLRLGY